MKPLTKGLLVGCGGLLVLGAMFVAFGVWLYRTQGPGIMEGAQEAVEDGKRAGASRTGEQCVAQGLDQAARGTSMADGVRAPIWMQSCLEASSTGHAACAGVPAEREFTASLRWRFAECERRGYGKDQRCTGALAVVQRFCHASDPFAQPPAP
jgi:hypothetical protein